MKIHSNLKKWINLVLVGGACLFLGDAAHAEGLYLSVNVPVDEALLTQSDVYLFVGVYITTDPGWIFDSVGYSAPEMGDDSLDVSSPSREPNPPNTPPPNPLFAVIICPDSQVGLYTGTVVAQAHSEAGLGTVIETVPYQVRVLSAQGPPPAVPEPASALLLGLGTIMTLGAVARRRL